MGEKKSWKSELPDALVKYAMIVGGVALILVVSGVIGGAEAVGTAAYYVAGVGIAGYLIWEVIRNLFFSRPDDK